MLKVEDLSQTVRLKTIRPVNYVMRRVSEKLNKKIEEELSDDKYYHNITADPIDFLPLKTIPGNFIGDTVEGSIKLVCKYSKPINIRKAIEEQNKNIFDITKLTDGKQGDLDHKSTILDFEGFLKERGLRLEGNDNKQEQ